MTPGAEFNTYADSVAAARVYALTSPNPKTTMPPVVAGKGHLPTYPEKLSRQLKVKLFPLGMSYIIKVTQYITSLSQLTHKFQTSQNFTCSPVRSSTRMSTPLLSEVPPLLNGPTFS